MYTKKQIECKLYDLEVSIMSCLLLEPELMKKIILEDKHFIKHQRLWQFMKAFYAKFKTFDASLMISICKDKFQIVEYVMMLLECEATTTHFDLYQKQLIELYKQAENDKWIKNKIYEWANHLYVGNITIQDFKDRMKELENLKKEAKNVKQ